MLALSVNNIIKMNLILFLITSLIQQSRQVYNKLSYSVNLNILYKWKRYSLGSDYIQRLHLNENLINPFCCLNYPWSMLADFLLHLIFPFSPQTALPVPIVLPGYPI